MAFTDLVEKRKIESSFLSIEKDLMSIMKKLFQDSQPHSNTLKKLLIVQTPDCLDNPDYDKDVAQYTVHRLKEEGYLAILPRFKQMEGVDIKNYLIISFSNFSPTYNSSFRDCIISFDIICHQDYADLGDFRLRQFKIAGVIDGILNKGRLSGIGTLEFIGGEPLLLNEDWCGLTLSYRAVHGKDDMNEN